MTEIGGLAATRNAVVFVSLTGGLGGPTRSLATLLAHLDGRVDRVLVAPRGAFTRMVEARHSSEQVVPMPTSRRLTRVSRLLVAVQLAWWALRNRPRLLALHANGQAELNVSVLAALLSRRPLIVWAHASEASPSIRLLAPLWRRLLSNVRWAPVSEEARAVLLDLYLVDPSSEIRTVPNPIDPDDVVFIRREGNRRVVTVGFLRGKASTSGFSLIPEVVDALSDLPVRWLLFTNPPSDDAPVDQRRVWERLEPLVDRGLVEMRGKVERVDQAYGECDIVFCPSVRESFGRVTAEAMLNGLPVVASDIPPLRRLLGDEEAGLLFPVGDAQAAAKQIRRLVEHPELREELGRRRVERARRFAPRRVAEQMHNLYRGAP